MNPGSPRGALASTKLSKTADIVPRSYPTTRKSDSGPDSRTRPLLTIINRPMTTDPTMISVVIPIFNEEETLPELLRRTTAALGATGRPWELLFVDDGSRDRSA